MPIVAINDQSISVAAEFLRQGKLVAFPTETVYGLGADASNSEAVGKIFQVKGRPADHPLIVHLAYPSQIGRWAENVPDTALRLAGEFWPGPLTLILQKNASVPAAVTGGQQTVALRVPDHPVALWLLRTFGGGIAAPSANRFGRISPTQARHVAEELGDDVDLILDGGPCTVGVESTILDLSGAQPTLLRPGRIARSQLEAVLGAEVALTPQHAVRAPGMMAVHYAPTTPAYLCPSEQLLPMMSEQMVRHRRIGMLTYSPLLAENPLGVYLQRLPEDVEQYEAELYNALRKLDKLGLGCILIEQPPQAEAWHAVIDRLGKATVSH